MTGTYIEYQGDIEVYLGVNVKQMEYGIINLIQLQIIQDIIKQVFLQLNSTARKIPAVKKKILRRNATVPKFDSRFQYYGAIGRIKFLKKSMLPNIVYATNQCVKFYEEPRVRYGAAV